MGEIVFLNDTYPPHDGPGARLLADVVGAVARADRPIEVVCATPDGGGQAALPGVRVRRLCRKMAPARRLGPRLWHFLRFHIDAAIYFLRRGRPALAVLWTDPPLIDTVIGQICRWRRIPYLIVVQEYYPEYARRAGWLPGPIYALLRRWANHVHRGAARVIAISDDTGRLLHDRGVPSARVSVVENWCDPSRIPVLPLAAWLPRAPDRLVVRYGGSAGIGFDLETLARALELLREPERFHFVFHVRGIRAGALERIARRSRVPVTVEDWVAPQDWPRAQSECHAHLVAMPAAQQGCIFPSKIYAAMAAARPLVVCAPAGSAVHALLSQSGAGVGVPAGEPIFLAAAWESFAHALATEPQRLVEMGDRGRRFIERRWREANGPRLHAELIAAAVPSQERRKTG